MKMEYIMLSMQKLLTGLLYTNVLVIFTIVIGSGIMLTAAPLESDSNSGTIPSRHAMMYLSQYGWLEPSSKKMVSEDIVDIRKPIKEFQAFAGLNITGVLDEETLDLMNKPRCGVRDKVGHDARRRKRYALQGSRWKVRELTYKISKYPKQAETLGKNVIDSEIAQAFKVWEDHTNLAFKNQRTGKVHIEIRFEKGEHGDGDAFDGEGGTLAHAYFPVYGGDSHFDLDEKWTVKERRGTNLFQVAAHEFGHSLGLSHSDMRSALMAPFYRGYQPVFKLDEDDIQAIQALYGKKTTTPPTIPAKKPNPQTPIKGGGSPSRPTSGSSANSKLCNDPRIDAISTINSETYAFKGDEVYKLTDNGVAPNFPQKINSIFRGLPGDLDGAFTYSNDKSYFFKGSKYWRFTDMKMDSGYPKSISDGFAGIPENIDTVFVWSGNGKIYFLKGDKYYRFDPLKSPPVSFGYPKPIDNWGIPPNIDAALRYSNGYTYFFKGNNYWRFNDRNFGVDTADPPFPRNSGGWWFGCGKETMKTKDPSLDYQDNSDEAGEYDTSQARDFESYDRATTTTTNPLSINNPVPKKSWWKKVWSWVSG